MITIARDILSLLTAPERRQLAWLTLAVVLMGLVEVAGIASIMPFMAVVGNPEVVETNRWVSWVYVQGGFSTPESFLIFLGFVVLFVIVASNVFKAATTYLELKFVNGRTCSLSTRLFRQYLSQPYVYFLNQNTSVLGMNLLQEVNLFVANVLRPATSIISKVVVIVLIVGLLLYVDPILAVILMTVLGGSYAAIYMVVQRKLARLGQERLSSNAQRTKVTGEAFGGIKDLKILGREPLFFESFSVNERQIARARTAQQTISEMPRFVMETLSFGGILLIVIYFLMIKGDVGNTLPILALYAFSGYRLMPALQNTFHAVTNIRFNLSVLDNLKKEFAGDAELFKRWPQRQVQPLPFNHNIKFENVSFSYPGTASPVIRTLNLTIEKNSNVGFVGSTGSGKTTTVDILLGLLTPQEGHLKIDGEPVDVENLSAWQRNLGYVPQTIFLGDDTVAGNIAFGVLAEEIDMAAVEKAARIANLHEFVVNELPEKYLTPVGERGVRLSGGQRQRIGIARALYHNPEVLIMDEATSALDGITEDAVIQAIQHLAGKKTIITIAHRLTTLKDCDVIYVMEAGHVMEQGTYAELSKSSERFRAMARSAKDPQKEKILSDATEGAIL